MEAKNWYKSWPHLEEKLKLKLFTMSKPQKPKPRSSSTITGKFLILETPNSTSKKVRTPKKRSKWRLRTKVNSILASPNPYNDINFQKFSKIFKK